MGKDSQTMEIDTSPRNDGVMRVIRSFCHQRGGPAPTAAPMRIRDLSRKRAAGKNNSAGGDWNLLEASSKHRRPSDCIKVYIP